MTASLRTRTPLERVTALVLSQVMAATSVWGVAPPAPLRSPSVLRPVVAAPSLAEGNSDSAFGGTDEARARTRRVLSASVSSGLDGARDATPAEPPWDGGYMHGSGGGSSSHANKKPIYPILECVSRQSLFHWTAYFGYRNDNATVQDIAIGSKNFIAPGPANQGQPKRFQPGRSPASARFAVPFSGLIPLAWALRGPDGKTRVALATYFSDRCPAAPPPPPPPPTSCQTVFYGPQRFDRTGCGPDGYRATIDVPASVSAPFLLRVKNGAPNGSHRVSSAKIEVDGKRVFGPSDFSQSVAQLERVAPFAAGERSKLKVVLTSAPGSYLTVEACGGSGDVTPPVLSLLAPAPVSTITDPTPAFVIRYDDPAGAGQVSGSGVDPATLSVTVDGVDRSSLFARQLGEATAQWPAELALASGSHQIVIRISDRAGNAARFEATFSVDAQPPTLSIAEPAPGAFLQSATPLLRFTYSDAQALDVDSFSVVVDGVDRTSWFTVGAAAASAVPPAALAAGPHQVVAEIQDEAGNVATVAATFTVDLVPPSLVIGQPRPGERLGSDLVELIVQFGDDQGIDPASFRATIDGAPATISVGPDGAMGFAGPLADGGHRFEARVRDRAGRETVATVDFSVDRTRPALEIFEPAPGLITRNATPEIVVRYSDAQGIDPASFAATVAGTARTSLFTVGETEARATLDEATRLPEGAVSITAEVADTTGNRATATATITVDTVAPQASLVAPAAGAYSNAAQPEIRLAFADPAHGTGVDPALVRIRLDGAVVSERFAVGADGAVGTPEAPLAEGVHTLDVELFDRAGNSSQASFTFKLDLTGPEVVLASPTSPFVSTPDPEISFTLSDAAAGIDEAAFQVLLLSPSLPERDVSAEFSVTCEAEGCAAQGTVESGLADGSHRFTVRAADRAGNVTTAPFTFEVDTVSPSLTVEAPALDAFLNSGTPDIRIRYTDDRSGIDITRISVRVDGAERAAGLVVGGEVAIGPLTDGTPLADGPHSLEVVVFDRAGNASDVQTQGFVVDTVAPVVAAVAPPAGAWLGTRTPEIRFTWSDVGSGLDLAWTRIRIDGIQREGLSPQPDGITLMAPALADGVHEALAEVRDLAGNVAQASLSFRIDTSAPVVPEVQAGDDGYFAEVDESGHATITGRVTDLDPGVTISCQLGGVPSAACACTTPGADGQFSCSVPLSEGANDVEVIARDGAGNETTIERTLTLDTTDPALAILAPPDGEATAATAVDVQVEATDASPLTLTVNGVEATRGTCSGSTCAFSASGVVVGDGPFAILTATATDPAGNAASSAVTLRVDRVAPVVAIHSPAPGSVASGVSIEVVGTVDDASAVLVEVNGIPATVVGGGPFTGAPLSHTFRATVPVIDGAAQVEVVAHDEAGNTATAHLALTVDSVAPVLEVTSPAPGLVTREATVVVAGTVSDATAVTVTVDGQAAHVSGGAFAHTVALSGEGPRTLVVRAVDAAGNVATQSLSVVVDRTSPTLSIAAPAEGAVVLALPIALSGTVSDAAGVVVRVDGVLATVDQSAWSAQVSPAEGAHTIEVVATDAAGNEIRVLRSVRVDLSPPELTVSAPAAGLLTRETTVAVAGTVREPAAVTVTVNAVPAEVTAGDGTRHTGTAPAAACANACSFTATAVLAEGDSQILVVATDEAGRAVEYAVPVTRDSTPPVVALDTPETISAGRPGQAVASIVDNLSLQTATLEARVSAECVVGTVQGTGASLILALAVPECAHAGDTVTVTLTATDTAGNAASLSRAVRVVADGAIAGQALDAMTGLPLAGVEVAVAGAVPGPVSRPSTDEAGRYALPAGDSHAVLVLTKPGYTAVERVVQIVSGVGTVAVDAFLTPLAEPVTVDATSGAVHVHVPRAPSVPPQAESGSCTAASAACTPSPVRLTLPPGTYRATGLSPQALPNLLPLGWSAVAALELSSDGPVPPASLAVEGAVGPLHLARYSFEQHAWTLEAADLPISESTATATLPGAGSYAVVIADAALPPLAVPAPGEVLEGLPMAPLPAAAASAGRVTPAVIPPTGGTAIGSIEIAGADGVPSGTVVQAEVSETFTLASGETASSESRTFDIVIARKRAVTSAPPSDAAADPCALSSVAPSATLCASFPITPSRTYSPAALADGRVHLDILAGREGVRGTVGGSEAVTLTAGDVSVAVPAGALAEDLAFAVEHHALSTFLPATAGVVPLAELTFDASGATLLTAAEVSVAAAIAAGDSAVLAKVERIDGIPRLVVVAVLAVQAERVVSMAYPGLPGVRQGGRYVAYRIAGPVAFVAGTTTASGAPVQAQVTSSSLPFHALTRADGTYIVAVAPGPNTVTATVLGTSLRGEASVLVPVPASPSVPETTPLPIALTGVVTTATVTPADGAVAAAVTTSLTIEAQAQIAAASVTAGNVRLLDDTTEAAIPVRFVLSSSARTLSVIPLQAMAFATRYRLEAPGLRDTFGSVVAVPVTHFTTKADTPPVYDFGAIRFGYPTADGLVNVTAPSGTLPPGTEILIINAGNGVVATFTADNDGAIGTIFPAEFPATISDTLYVTITDPLGNVTTFTRSEYVAEDGTTGIGPGGGVVRGEGGVELRIPEGALKEGATFKIALVDPSELPTLFPNAQHETLAESLGAHHGSVLRLETSEGTRLEKEADLVFPVPDFTAVPEAERPTKPEDAFYYVHRRVERCADGGSSCPDPIVVFEVIDEAKVEGTGSTARILTASPPFAGVIGVMSGALLLYSMSWSYDPSLLGLPRPGLIRGKVLRTVWGSDGAAFKAVPDAHVTGTDAGGVALSSKDGGTFATSQGDGTYALWDYSFTGGTTRIDAALGPESATATAFEVSDGPGIGVYNKVAHANITFPAVEPPPVPPQVEIQVVQESTGNLISGVVVSGTTLQIGFRSNTPETEYTIYGARVAGQELAVRQAQQGDRPGWTHVVAEAFTPTNPGTYTVEAAAAPGVGSPVNTSTTFRVIAEGGSVETDPHSAPKVITARLYPKPNATGVPVTAFLNVAFTEPVRGIPGNVRLLAGETEIPIRISGVTPEGQVIEAISGDHEILTSLTIQPLAGLRYSTAYRLLLAAGITDLDPEPKALEPFELPFTTFGPASVGGTTDDFSDGSAGIVVLGDRAYLTRTNALVNGTVRVFDITDPVEPLYLDESEVFAPRPYDIVGEQAETGEKLIAVATGSTNRSKPASVLLFDASASEVPQFVGAASLTSSAADGFTSRIAIHGGFVYSATVRKGIQGVEIQRAKNTWSGLDSSQNPDLARQNAKTKLNTDGEGFGQDAVVINLPIPLKSNAAPYYLNDIKAADISGQTMVAVAGEPGLILAQPLISGITYQGRPEREGTRLDWGYALALGRLQNRDVAVVVGRGTIAGVATTLLITLGVSNPQAPLVLGAVSLSAELGALVPVDILLKDQTALVGVQNSTGDQGFVLLVNLSDLATPGVSGRLEGVAGRLALDENGLLYGSARLSTGGSSVNGGVKTATLGEIGIIRRISPSAIVWEEGVSFSERDIAIEGEIVPDASIESAQVEIYQGAQLVQTLPAQVSGSNLVATLPARTPVDHRATYYAKAVINRDGDSALRSALKEVPLVQIIFVDKRGEETFAPLTSDPRPVVILDPVTVQHVTLLADGAQAKVKVSGFVTDALADIVPENAADISAVTVGEQSLPVARVYEPVSVTRPFAFKGRFSGTVTVDMSAGPNTVVVEASNSVGGQGYDSFTINASRPVAVPEVVPTGNVHDLKFLDPFTLVVTPLSPDVADSVILFHGAGDQPSGEGELLETSPDSLSFFGVSSELGRATLTLRSPLTANDPTSRDVIEATLSTTGLSILDEELEFVETSADSGVFRNAARRLPSNDFMTVIVERPLDGDRLDTLKIKLRSLLDEDATELTETAVDSSRFTGNVPGLGDVAIEVHAIDEPVGEPARMLAFLDSSDLDLSAYYMRLAPVATPPPPPGAPPSEELRFGTQSYGPSAVEITSSEPTQTTILGVENNEGSAEGLFEPVWAVAKGLPSFQEGEQGEIAGRPFELTTAPAPAPQLQRVPRQVRFRWPLVWVTHVAQALLTNVLQAADAPGSAQDEAKIREYSFAVNAKNARFRRVAGAIDVRKPVAIRGTKMRLTTSYITAGGEPEVTGLAVYPPDGVTISAPERKQTRRPSSEGVFDVSLTFSVEVAQDATVGPRDLTFQFAGAAPKTFKKAFKVSRGRMVIFAVDGLSDPQFENVVGSPLDSGTALEQIFGQGAREQQRAVKKTVLTTFPPITFTRWASIFSGKTPGETGVAALQWFNRRAEIDPAGGHGAPSQCLGCGDFGVGAFVMAEPLAYNRHFKVDLIYDKLRERNLRSVVVMQQAGLGKGNAGGAGDDAWINPNGLVFGLRYGLAKYVLGGVRPESVRLDEDATRLAIDQARKLGDNFDLMVIYLAGLDHYVHGVGVSQGQGEEYIRSELHPRVNRVVRSLRDQFGDTTVFGVFSDHGHADTEPENFMDLIKRGESVNQNGFPTWLSTLQVNSRFSVGKNPNVRREEQGTSRPFIIRPNVLFVPQFGIANIYIAGNAPASTPDWRTPPSLSTIEPIVNNIFTGYLQNRDNWERRPVADILVRVPGSAGSFEANTYKVVPRDYDPDKRCGAVRCGLEAQLKDLISLETDGLGMGDDAEPIWKYTAVERVDAWESPNSGDIVLLANLRNGYHFGPDGIEGNHGSLTSADALVPVAFGYPGVTGSVGVDTLLQSILGLFGQYPDEPVRELIESRAIETFFLQR